MNISLKKTCYIVHLTVICFQFHCSHGHPGSTKEPSENLGGNVNKPVSQVFFPSSGILNSFENVTCWAEIEEQIFVLTKTRFRELQEEIQVLQETLVKFKAVKDRHAQNPPVYWKSCREEIGLFALKNSVHSETPSTHYPMLKLLKKIMNFAYLRAGLEALLLMKDVKYNQKQSDEFPSTDLGLTLSEWPNLIDFEFAMHSLIHIQEVYSFEYKNLPAVLSPGTNKPPELNAFHANEIGMHALYREHYAAAIEWLEYSREKAKQEKDKSISLRLLNSNLNLAIDMHNEMLLAEQSSDSLTTEDLFEDFVSKSPLQKHNRKRMSIPESKIEGEFGKSKLAALSHVNAICSGEDHRTTEERSSLYCWYDTNSSPARTILPYKKEFLSFEPEIIQVYDFLGNKLISTLLNSKIKCQWMAHTLSSQSFSEMMRTRTPSICWTDLSDLESFLKKMSSLTLADLRTNGSHAPVQLIHYLFGRFHSVHLDALQLKLGDSIIEKKVLTNGDRLISVLFYLNDVTAGGATAFPTAGMAAFPVKGSAIIWKNVYRNGTARLDTWHGGCPVIYGHKQTGIFQVHANSQFRTYPCKRNQLE